MNIKQMRELARLVRENELSSLEFREGDTQIVIKRENPQPASPAPQVFREALPLPPAPGGGLPMTDGPGVDFNHAKEVVSPLVGVFYAAPSPEETPFVAVGDKVKKGDVLCIVEAMKLMNEITADQDGEVVDVCVRSGDVVEYGQTLFKLF